MCFSYLIVQLLILGLRYSECCFFFYSSIYGSSHRRCSVKKGVLKNFANFTGKHLFWSLFLIKLQASGLGLQLYQKETPKKAFSCEICEIFKNTYFGKHLRTTASEFIRDLTLFYESILKKDTNGKTNFQDGTVCNRKQHFEW